MRPYIRSPVVSVKKPLRLRRNVVVDRRIANGVVNVLVSGLVVEFAES